MSKKNLTNEILAKRFQDNFKLTHHAIQLAQKWIKQGKECSLALVIQRIEQESSEQDG